MHIQSIAMQARELAMLPFFSQWSYVTLDGTKLATLALKQANGGLRKYTSLLHQTGPISLWSLVP